MRLAPVRPGSGPRFVQVVGALGPPPEVPEVRQRGVFLPALTSSVEDVAVSAQNAGDALSKQVQSTGALIAGGLALFGMGLIAAALFSRARPPIVLMLADPHLDPQAGPGKRGGYRKGEVIYELA